MSAEHTFITADWPAPACVRAYSSCRAGGHSSGPWRSFNLAAHVGDAAHHVARNRELLQSMLGLPAPPQWLRQVHGTVVVDAVADGEEREGDAAYADRAGVVCAVLTADCLPVVIANRAGTEVAVAHCGWRGLAAGVLDATIARFRSAPRQLLAWLGPAIGPTAFEVGAEVRAGFLRPELGPARRAATEAAFLPAPGGKFHADLYGLARGVLDSHGIEDISGGGHCTVSEPAQFFSYRRDGLTGRMVTLAWIAG